MVHLKLVCETNGCMVKGWPLLSYTIDKIEESFDNVGQQKNNENCIKTNLEKLLYWKNAN